MRVGFGCVAQESALDQLPMGSDSLPPSEALDSVGDFNSVDWARDLAEALPQRPLNESSGPFDFDM